MAVSSPSRRRRAAVRQMVIPQEWTFRSREVAADFDRHVREQLPWYDLATGIVAHLARHYCPTGGVVVDLGASTGNVGRAIAPMLEARGASLVAVDASPEMVVRYQGPGQVHIADAREFDLHSRRPDVVVCFLCLMFIPVADRPSLLARIKDALRPGGAAIVFDKLEPRAGYLGTACYRLTLAAKHEAGAPAQEVIEKELSISGVQRPMSEGELRGFVEVFRFGDFAGFVYERPCFT